MPAENLSKSAGRVGLPGQSELPPGKSWFLGSGINDYRHFPPLNNAVRDVQAIQTLLQERYDLNEAELLLDEQASRRAILRKLEELARKVKPEEKVLILFSGHGYLSPAGLGFWVPVEAESGYSDDYIPNSRLRDFLQEIRSRHTLIVSDACFSGALFAKGPTRRSPEAEEVLETKISRYGFCSGRSNEEVYDGPPGAHSPFAGSILSILRENQKPRLRVSLLAEEVMSRTASQYRQLPHHGPLFDVGDKGGQYVFRLRRQNPPWATAWARIEAHLKDLHAKILLFDEYTDQFFQADNLKAAYDLGVLLEHKEAFFIAKGTRFRLKEFSRKKTPFQEEAKCLLRDYKTGYTLPDKVTHEEPPRPQPKVKPAVKRRDPSASPNTFTDPRDGRTYQTVELNGLVWMVENLNYDVGEDCWFLGDDPNTSSIYGRLYSLKAAKKACPPRWRLPTDEEWEALANELGGYYDKSTGRSFENPARGYDQLRK